MAWAQTFEISTNVGNPEHQYLIKNGNDIWMAANTAPTQNNKAYFAFFEADGDDAYKIYSVGEQKWVSYDKTSTTDDTKGFASLVDSKDDANAWKITATTISGGKSGFNVQPFNNDGTVSNRYWNWNAGVGNGGGFGYTYDDAKTVGLWRQNAAADAGSGWVLLQEGGYSITDAAGNVFEGEDIVNGQVDGFTLENVVWDGSKYTATINFPFPVSKEGGVINATTIASAAEAKKWLATDNSVIMVQTSGYDANDNNWLWAIYPQFNNGAFTFKIKSIGKDKWIYTEATGSKVDTGNNDDSAGNAAGAVTLADNGTAFDVVLNGSNYGFHYKVGDNNQYLSINSKNDTKVYLGVHTGLHIGSNVFFNKIKTISPVAKIGKKAYYTLAEAVAAAGANETITLLADVTLAERVTIPADKTLTIDLNGKSISMEESIIATAYAINNLGNLTITDGVGGGSINARGVYNGYGDGGANVTSATITVLGGTFNAKGTNGGAAIFNYGTANVKGGKFTSIGGYSLNNQAGANMNIADGVEVTGGIYNNQDAELIVNGGNISNNRSGCHTIYAWNAKVTVNGGSIHNENSGNATIMSAGTSEVTINGGTISIKDGRVPGNGNTWTSCLTDAANTAEIIVNGGTFNGGFRVQAGSSMTINGGSFNDCFGSGYNIYGTAVVKGGTFTDAAAQTFAKNNIADDYKLGEDGKVVYAPVVAKIGETKYETLDAAFAAATEGATITLFADATPALTSQRAITKAAVVELNGKTMTLTEDDLYFGTTTFKNGTIVVDPSVNASTAVFWMFENQTLTFDNVAIVATGVTGTYLIGINGGTGTAVNLLNGSSITIDNESTAGLTAVICDNGTGNTVTIDKSVIAVKNIEGRFYLGGKNGSVSVKNTTVTLNGVKEGFYLRAGQSLDIAGASKLDITLNSTEGRYGINLTDPFITYTKAEGATVNATVYDAPAPIVIGTQKFATLADALAAASTMTGDVTVVINEKVTLNQALTGSYSSIKFVGPSTVARAVTTAEIYLDVQGYITAAGKNVAFENLTLSKSQGGFINNAGFMNVAFGVYEVAEVTYTNCTFANGAYAAAGNVTFTGCTFKRSHDKYGLWAYGNVDVTVDGCTFADYRGIKMYAENGANAGVEKANLTVKNTDFRAVDNKPAIVLTYGESVALEGNTYSPTGTFELDLDGQPNGVAVASDVAPTCKNDNGACGVLVDGKIYTTVAQAAAVATSGSTVTLLYSTDETVVFAKGVELELAQGVVAPQVSVIPANQYTFAEFNAALYNVNGVFDGQGTAVVVLKDSERSYYNNKTAQFFLATNDGWNGQTAIETISIKGVTFRFEDDDLTNNFTSGELQVFSNDMAFEACTFIGTAVSPWGKKGDGNGCLNAAFTNCNWKDLQGRYGVHQNKASVLTVTGSTFENCERGIHTSSPLPTNITITGNTFTGIGDAYGVLCLSEQGDFSETVMNITGNTAEGQVFLRQLNTTTTYAQVAAILDTNNNVYGTSYVSNSIVPVPPVAKIGEQGYATLQAAINAVQNGETITLLADITEDVTVTEKAGLYYTIDGAGKKMTGTITVSSLSDTNDNRRITIKNINFVDTVNGRDFITSVNTNHYPRLTVEGCSFTGTGKEAANSVAVRLKSSHSVVIKDCTGTGLHSFLQNTSGWNLTIENVTVTESKSGLALGTVQGVTVKGANIDVDGYGIRLDAQYNNNAVLENNTVEAFIPVVVRKASVESNITVNGTNTMTATNTDGIWFAAGTSEYETNGQMPTATTAKVLLTVNDTKLDIKKAYGNYVDPVAKVGDKEFGYIEDAIAAWTNNTTLTLLADVTLSDVIQLSSTEYHILDLGTYTMTAASKKDAIQIVNNGRSSASYALDIKADAENPGGITATGKAVVKTTGKSGVKDRPIIRFYNGVFTGSYVVYHSGSNGTNCPQFWFYGGEFNGTVYANRALFQFYGGTFNGSLQMSVDSSAYALISGGTFSKLSNMMGSALNSSKFTIGSAKGVYDREVYVDENGNYVIAASEPAEGIGADVAKTPRTNDYLAYSKVATEGQLGYTSAEVALNNNPSATVTVYADEIDMPGTFKGTIIVPVGESVKIINAPADLKVATAEGYFVDINNGVYESKLAVAKIGEQNYASLDDALKAATNNATVELLWAEGDAPIAMNGTVFGKNVTITGTAKVDWSKGFLFVGRGGEGNATVTFDGAKLTSASNSASYGIHVSGREKNTDNKYDGTLVIKNSTIELDYLINKGAMTLDKATLTVKNGFAIGGRPASETESGADATATISLTNESKLVVNNHNGMGLGYEAIGVINIDATSTFETTQSFLVTAKGTMNVAGKASITGTLTNNGAIVLTDAAATLTSTECGNVTTSVADYKVVYADGAYKVVAKNYVAKVGDAQYETLAEALVAAEAGATITLVADVTEDVTTTEAVIIEGAGKTYTGAMTLKADATFKNVNFDGKGFNGYAITTRGANDLTIEGCTAKNYGYGFVQLASGTALTTVKDVTVSNVNYGVKVDYSNAVVLDNVDITAGVAALLNSNYGEKTITIKNSKLNILGTWKRNDTMKTTYVFEGENTVEDFTLTVPALDIFKNAAQVVGTTAIYGDLNAAFAAVESNGTVKLLGDFTTEASATVPAGKVVTLDLNGKTISQEKACTASYEMINNKGNLTITGEGKISFKDTGAGDPNFGWGSYTVRNEGTLVVENGTIEHLGEQNPGNGQPNKHMYCAIFQYSGKSTINGGTISTPTYRSARLWKGEMTINGGTFDGQLWVQAVDNSANLVINGGTFAPRGNDGSSVYVENSSKTVAFAVTGGTFETKIGVANAEALAGAITGGTFSATAKENTAAALIATGYVFGEADANGYYTIADDPATHYINNVEEFVAFRDAVNGGNDFAGVAVYLTADIDLTGIDWSVNIGDDAGATFDGTFDGQGHTIKNLTSTETAQKGDGYICTGLFGAIHGGAVLKDFTIENVTINTGDFTGNNVAAVVGFAWQATGSIENVHVTGNININAKNVTGVGAILGYDYYSPALTVKNCSVIGNDGSAILGKSYVGGAVGYASSKIAMNSNTIENVSVTATGSVGAIAGIMLCGSSAADNTVKNVALTATGELWKNSAAVVAGTITNGGVTVTNTTVENVTANDAVAALVGGQLVEKPTAPIAKVEAKIGDKYYTTLENAYVAAQAGATIELLAPVVIASGETLTLDKDVTVVYTSNVAGEDMFTNRGTLNISAGTITYVNTDKTGSNVTVSTISSEPGSELNITGGTVENKTVKADGSSIYSYAIDMLTNGNLGDVTATIAGGTVYSDYMAIRQFNNGTACKNTLNITGGHIYGAKRAVQIHMDNNAAVTAINGGKIEAGEGGYALCNFAATSDLAVTGGEFIGAVYSARENFISGGIYDAEVYAGYCAEGYMPTVNADGTYGVTAVANLAAAINNIGYTTFAEALAAAEAGATITLLADITEDVTISKKVTIDGAGKTYTGKMTLKADATIKNVNFDGKGYNGYAVETRGANYVTIEDCTAKNYGYGFVQLASGTVLTTVKNVTVSNMNYGVKVDYSNAVVLENVDITANVAAVLNSNYGEKTITVKNSKLNIYGTWTRNNTTKTNIVFEGENTVGEFKTDAAIDNFKLAVAGTTLTAPQTIEVTTDEKGYSVKYEDGKYFLKGHVAKIDDNGYATLAEALTAAQKGNTITFIADITEDVTISKDVTIDGAGKTYTGKMSLTSNKGTVTIKNVNFDGKGYNGYAVETRGVYYLTVESCTAKNYGFGFIQQASSTVLTTVKNVTVCDMSYGVKVDYGTDVVLENVDITAGVAAVLNSNYGEKTISIKNSKLNIYGTWTRNNTKETTIVFEGENTVGEFKHDAAIDNIQLAHDATLTASEGLIVAPAASDCLGADYDFVTYENGAYKVVCSYIEELTIVDGAYTEFENQNAKIVGTLTYERDMTNYVGKWQPLYVPFEIPVSKLTELGYQVAIFYDVHFDLTDEGDLDLTSAPDLHILKITSGTLKANYPYVIKASADHPQLSLELSGAKLYSTAKSEMNSVESGSTITRFIFAGTYTKATPAGLTGDVNIPCYAINTNGNFQKMGTAANLPAFRVYMSIVAKDGSYVILAENAAESIRMRVIGEENENGETIIYDVEMDETQDVDYIYDLQGRRVLEPQKGNLYIINGKKVIF